MPSLLFVLRRSKNFTSVAAVRMPPSVSVDHYLGSKEKTSKIRPRSSFIIPCCHIQASVHLL